MSKIHTYYLPTYLAEKDPADTRCTLMIRRYQRYKTTSGKLVTKLMLDAVEYPSEEAMAQAIEAEHMRELPSMADGNPMYVPLRLRAATVRRVNKL